MFDASILTRISLVTVKEIRSNKYTITKNIGILLYLLRKPNIGKPIVIINKKNLQHIITYVISSKKNDFIIFKKFIYIRIYNIRVFIKVIY